jgi:hypothetical protein
VPQLHDPPPKTAPEVGRCAHHNEKLWQRGYICLCVM